MRAALFLTLFLPALTSFAETDKLQVVRDGSTAERAVMVPHRSTHKVVDWEWQWIKGHHPFASASIIGCTTCISLIHQPENETSISASVRSATKFVAAT
jgi:hypothetical protein